MTERRRTVCFTSASYSYLDRARTLFHTVEEFHPEWDRVLVLVDEPAPGLTERPEVGDNYRTLKYSELGIEGLSAWAFEHNVVEMCTAVKGAALCQLLGAGYDRAVYLDPDIALFGRMDEVESLLEVHDIVLTPHLLAPERGMGIEDNELSALKHGVFNLGFLAVANRPEGNRAAQWWRDRLLQFCFEDIPNGVFTDQKWWDLAPAFFPSTAVLRHRGYNVASWNLSDRLISINRDGSVLAGAEPLVFFHFTKVDTVGEEMLVRYAGNSTAVLEILKWYRARVRERAVSNLPKGYWHFSTYADGRAVTREDRLAMRRLRAAGKNPDDPFRSLVSIAQLEGAV